VTPPQILIVPAWFPRPVGEEHLGLVPTDTAWLQIANDLECPTIVSELSGDPNQPLRSERALHQSMEELIPDFERHGAVRTRRRRGQLGALHRRRTEPIERVDRDTQAGEDRPRMARVVRLP
jgi:hypothetical protein